ncbi:MAG: hypothetical protein QOH72_794 [Solirubrobacteraceae bacterium]|nr:hypothetical protein [Solirubrobacteraceae bacterium]
MRRPEPLDPAIERELSALDAALDGAPDADAELAALVRDVRAEAPVFDRAALDARVAAGFASERPARRRPRARLRPRVLVPALGAVAAALLALVFVVGARDGNDGASRPAAVERSGGGSSAASGSAAPKTSAAPGVAAAPPVAAPPAVAAPAPAPARRVERTVSLSLRATPDRFDAVTDGVVRATQRFGGFVAESELLRGGTGGTATFALRIPAARLDAAVADLSRLAHVRSIQQSTADLTGATDGTGARLRDARTQRRALVAALATASGARAARLRARLDTVSARVRSLDRALRALRARTAYATVDLTVTAPRRRAAAAGGGDGRWTPAAAWRDARRGLEIAAGVAIITLAFALPLALVGGLAALAAGAVRRRRREASLDAA